MTRLLWVAMLGAHVGCAGSGAEREPPAADAPQTQGSEAEATAQDGDPVAAKARAPSAAGPSTLTVQVQVDGQPASAQVRVLSEDGQEQAAAPSGQAMTLEAGEYAMEIHLQDALVDKPVQRRSLTLLPGGNVTETAEFPWSKVQLKVRVNGALARGAEVDLLRNGEKVATLESDAPHVLISPGRYRAVVRTRGAEIEVEQLMFPQGATRTVPVNVRM